MIKMLYQIDPFTHPNDRVISSPNEPVLHIVAEKEHYLVIDKPAGLPTHPNDFQDLQCVANHFIRLYPDSLHVGEDALRPGIVHRLDTYTSGLLIVAKTQEGFKAFRQLFDQRNIQKTYQALVLGNVYPDDIEIDTPLAHHHKNPRKMVALIDDRVEYRSKIREAKTMVHVRERFDQTTWIDVKTLTGRMHQVRVHMASIDHPLVGDQVYQNQRQKQQDQYGLGRHFLHASKLVFKDPWTGLEIILQSNLPFELQQCIDTIKKPAMV
ncbi:MAG: RluA family pseudouridine synthase [Bdellovibrionota bacterium]